MRTAPSRRDGAPARTIKNILVPIDFSETSLRALPVAQQLAKRAGARLHLAHVQEYTYPAVVVTPGAPVVVPPAMDYEKLRTAAEKGLQKLAKDRGLNADCRAEIGSAAFDTLCWIAAQLPADLIVSSTHGRTGIMRAFLGSTAERLVQHAPCPVLVTRGKKGPSVHGMQKILVPVDYSQCSLAGLRYAIDFAKNIRARLLVLHVVDLAPQLLPDEYRLFDIATYYDAAARSSEGQMRAFLQKVDFKSVPYETCAIAEFCAEGICGVAANQKIDLIIMATHGRTGLKHMLIGSVAERVVRHASCSVLVVPSHPGVRLANLSAKRVGTAATSKPRKLLPEKLATPRMQKPIRRAAPEHRLTNKFRESHARRQASEQTPG